MKPSYKSGRNLTTDNWYTSYGVAEDLLSENITIVGTMREDKRQIPAEFKKCKGRETHSSIFEFQQDATLVSHVTKKLNVSFYFQQCITMMPLTRKREMRRNQKLFLSINAQKELWMSQMRR
ncbi:hypothetical protein AVEN_132841-1 [Araneus ventricosus]|uniref:PiggyBac transposable element-derived protein domain-containing protein n=1 Tax=Araneus ventricosus TaxID=182803 RepID=A0A4Y2HFF4_ARAVE|nr:hypothetical protein AVEN_132841-1 [Araneus ventricosus]